MPIIPGLSRGRRMNPLELRTLAKIQAELLKRARGYFDKEGFIEVIVPRITKVTGSCENMDTLFKVKYFAQQAYLIQTGQLFLEILIPVLNKVWCYGPSFRAEPRIDNRHLTEFTLLEMEFCGDFEQLLSRIEGLLDEMIKGVIKHCVEDLERLSVNKRVLEEFAPPFQKITYDDAVKLLNINSGQDLNNKHEEFLLKSYGNRPLFITHHPERIKFFNMKTNSDNPKVVNSADLILPFSGEAVGAAEREFEYKKVYGKLKRSDILRQLKQRGGNINDFDLYLSHLQQHGSIQHAGCGVGVNRVMQFILGSRDIRESTLFPLNREKLM